MLFLDEATAGLDPQSRLALWEILERLNDEGQTILLTTHYMEEVGKLCDRVAIMDHGRILALDTPDALERGIGADAVVAVRSTGDLAALGDLLSREVPGVTRTRIAEGMLQLHLAGGVVVRPVWSRALPSAPSSVRVHQDSVGDWWASFVVKVRDEPLPATGRAIGIDWGVRAIATTTTDAFDLSHRAHGKSAAAKLARYQKMMARRKPEPGHETSKGYKRAKRQTARVHRKVAWQRQDDGRKWAKSVVRNFDQMAVEDFSPKFLTKSTMAKKAADAAIATTKRELSSMAAKHCRELSLVPPPYTTMDCSSCGARTKHRLGLSQRIFACTSCGDVMHRDKNAAANMVARAGFVPAGAEGARPGPEPPVLAA